MAPIIIIFNLKFFYLFYIINNFNKEFKFRNKTNKNKHASREFNKLLKFYFIIYFFNLCICVCVRFVN